MAEINFSVVVTVFNEADSIVSLLDSLLNQQTPPSEIIVVDAGSTDSTPDLIHQMAIDSTVPIRVFHQPGLNRSAGRNFGINKASNEYIAVTDAGCEADRYWLAELAAGFNEGTEAVAGFYLPVINQPIQQLFAQYVTVSPENFNQLTYLPSSRSLAFTKDLWKAVGKYPEHLETCEDLVFASKIKARGKMAVRYQALVYWRQADGLVGFYKQIQGYAKGDVEAGYWPHLKHIATVWLRYVLFLVFPPLFLLYLVYPLWKHHQATKAVRDGLVLPLVQLTADWGVLTGSLMGIRSTFLNV